MSMNHTVQSATHALNFIIDQSKAKVHENKIAKKYLTPYSSSSYFSYKNDMLLQAGVSKDRPLQRGMKEESPKQKPASSSKDNCSFFSVKKVKQSSANPLQNQQNEQDSSLTQSKFKKMGFLPRSHTASKAYSKRSSSHNTYRKNHFEKLNKDLETDIPKHKRVLEAQIDQIRTEKAQEQTDKKLEESINKELQTKTSERQKKLANYLQNHIGRCAGSHTYDEQGSILLVNKQKNERLLKKEFPPSVRYSIDGRFPQENYHLPLREKKTKMKYKAFKQESRNSDYDFRREHQNIRGARGEIFKSSVLKTVNLSKISLGVTNAHESEVNFMKRNDLFNNNHCRQTTSIPFISVEDGSVFREIETNQVVGKKENEETEADSKMGQSDFGSSESFVQRRAKSTQTQSRDRRGQHYQRHEKGVDSKMRAFLHNKHSMPLTQQKHHFADREQKNQDSRYSLEHSRPKTVEVGRIKKGKNELVQSLIE